MKVQILIGVLIFLIAVNLGVLGSYVYTQFRQKDPPAMTGRPAHPFFHPRDRSKIKLEKEQRQQLRTLLNELHQESAPLRERLWNLEREAFLLIRETPIPMDKIDRKLEEIAAVRLQMSQQAVKKLITAQSFLKPEQQEHFFNMILQARPPRPEKGARPPRDMPPAPEFE